MSDRADFAANSNKTAVAFMIGASALVAFTSLIAKILSQPEFDATGALQASPLHPLQISAGRFGFALIALLVFLSVFQRHRPRFKAIQWRVHIARSFCGWAGISGMFAAVALIPVAEATAISFLNPVFAMGFAVRFLGEALTLRKGVAALVALVGAVLILKPGDGAAQIGGVIALAAAVFMAAEVILIKRLSGDEPAAQILVINNAIGASLAICVATVFWGSPSPAQWFGLLSIGTIMVCAQSLFIQAMKRADASLVTGAFYAVLVFAALYDYLWFGTVLDGLAAIGGGLILTSAMVLALSRKT